MTDFTPFDNRPDPVLGAELRAALTTADSHEFLSRTRAAVLEAGAETAWDVLSRWAPRGLVAAAAAAALAWVLAGRQVEEMPIGATASAPVRMEVFPGQSEATLLTVAVLEGR